jgi:murein DD-endopeptidase MepM/ murein hydrolase activator NlpD
MFPLITRLLRVEDAFGRGHFGASRGFSRTHQGVDYLAKEGDNVLAPVSGIFSKYGFAYPGDSIQRYIEIKSEDNIHVIRVFYCVVLEGLEVGQTIKEGQIIGRVGNISKKYDTKDRKMGNHLHIEVRKNKVLIDPEVFFYLKSKDISILTLLLVPSAILLIYYLLKR